MDLRTRPAFIAPSTLLMILWGLLGTLCAQAQTTVFNEVHTIASAQTGVPIEHDFDISNAGTYTVTLADLGATLTPSAPLAAVKLAVTGGDAIVGAPLVGAGTLTLTALAPGTYQLHIVGTPGDVPGSGPIGVTIAPAGGAAIDSFQDKVALPSAALPNGESVLDDSFMVASTGSYTVTLADAQLPQALNTLSLLLIAQGATVPLATLPSNGSMQATVTLTAGVTYRIFGVGQADSTVNAGLFTATVAAAGGGAIVYGRAIPVGTTLHIGSPVLAAGSEALVLSDLKTPAALTQAGAVLTFNGQAVAQLSAPGSQSFTAVAGTYELYAAATAATAAPAAGSYALQVKPATGSATYSVARAVTAPGSATSAYSFDTAALTAGTYTVSLTDFQFPADLSNLTLAAVQFGAPLGTLPSGTTSLPITAAAGPVSLLVFTQAASAGGLFGIDVSPTGGSSVFAATQGVGVLFIARQIAIPAAGNYSVTATDLGFPAAFANYDTVVTQGATQLGSIFGGGTFVIAATPGNYFVNFIAQPAGTDMAGTYALTVASAPPSPVVMLSADHSSVASGQPVDLVWSSTNATTCTASGGWTGAQKTSGVVTTAALTSNTTFTLTCMGPGGSAAQSVSVTVTSGGGGGGALDWWSVLALAAAFGLRMRARAGQSAS